MQGRAVELSRKDTALLACVALHGSMPSPRLAAMLWPETDERRARSSLGIGTSADHRHLSRARSPGRVACTLRAPRR
jgi:hypothetical protein